MKLLSEHLLDGKPAAGESIALGVDQTLTQDATGTLVMLALEQLGLDRVRTGTSAQYVDHNLLQLDSLNATDHHFLDSACRRFGIWYSRPGNGISHAVHMQRFGRPGLMMLGSDSHTPAAGALGMLAIGVGGMDVAMAMSGAPFVTRMPEIWGVRLTGRLPEWLSAKDVILEMLRRHGVSGGRGRIIEYYGPGLAELPTMDRHVIANMGAELGATTTVFPADEETRRYLKSEGRERDFREIVADDGCGYDHHDEIDLSRLEPLIARPSSPGNVVPVREIAGEEITQAYIGSSANPGWRDFAAAAQLVEGETVPSHVSFDINPTSRQLLQLLIDDGTLATLVAAGARVHQAGCNGCIGMGQAPATGRNSLRTTPRNFPGRSGTAEDSVFLCSPETAAASAVTGRITDPRTTSHPYRRLDYPEKTRIHSALLRAPAAADIGTELVKGESIGSIPDLDPLPDAIEAPILLKLGDNISTDEILPAGSDVLPLRSNIQRISDFSFSPIDPDYVRRADETDGDHAIFAGHNFGQGSSREHAVLAPRARGLRVVLARSYARIYRRNLINFGVLPLIVEDDDQEPAADDVLRLDGLRDKVAEGGSFEVRLNGNGRALRLTVDLDRNEVDMLLAGGRINQRRAELEARS